MENNSFKLDLTKILKDAPKGLKLWCDVYGEVEFDGVVDGNTNYAISFLCGEDDNDEVTSDGRLFYGYEDANCVLWPSKDCRTWENWQSVLLKTGDIPKFDPATLQPFDKVLVRNNFDTEWHAGFFQHTDETCLCPYVMIDGSMYTQVIPFNDDTKHLIGKKDNPPEFYNMFE